MPRTILQKLCLQRFCLAFALLFAFRLCWAAAGDAGQRPSYVGSAVCARCHEAISRSYAATPMAQTSGAVGDEFPLGEYLHAPSGVRYRAFRKGDGAYLEFRRVKPVSGFLPIEGQRRLAYYIGSGAEGRSYVIAHDRFLFEAPATWYSRKRRWDASPGYENDREIRLNRPIDANCLYCHASQVRPIYGAQNRFTDPPFEQNGVSCERCHGPGSEHSRTGERASIVNPMKLDATRRDAVCAQCHLAGEARVERLNQKISFYRPGDALSDFVSYFVRSDAAPKGIKVNSHVENLAGSRCAKQSGPSMSCTSCHDPHSAPPSADRAVYYREKCLSCHQRDRLPVNRSHGNGADCIACHMPRAKTMDGGHGVMTDHSIPKQPAGVESVRGHETASQLIPFPGYSSDSRSLGLALAELWSRTGEEFYEKEARRLLEEALSGRNADAEALTRLAHLIEIRGETERALALYEAALKLDPQRVVAAVNAGALHASRGNLDRAIDLWRGALGRNPGLTEASVNLAQALLSRGDQAGAAATVRQALMHAPDHPELHTLNQIKKDRNNFSHR